MARCCFNLFKSRGCHGPLSPSNRRWRASSAFRSICSSGLTVEGGVDPLLGRQWLLKHPASPVSWVEDEGAAFAVVRDDLLHPFLGGNKLRKLDGLWPQLQQATDVVTCGGLQSAHTTAVAAVCAEHGITPHLLVRGERPAVPTGHHLYTRMLGTVTYVSRAEYADREAMLARYAHGLELQDSSRRVAIIPEGAAQPEALLGPVRLVRWLATESELADKGALHIVADSGTGATATGLALGVALLGLPWRVTGVMLAGTLAYYAQQQQSLLEAFTLQYLPASATEVHQRAAAVLRWADRASPRKFGEVLAGEIARSRQVAQRHGIVVDPIWSLAAWEAAGEAAHKSAGREAVVMLHSGGMLGLCGLAQRFPDDF